MHAPNLAQNHAQYKNIRPPLFPVLPPRGRLHAPSTFPQYCTEVQSQDRPFKGRFDLTL